MKEIKNIKSLFCENHKWEKGNFIQLFLQKKDDDLTLMMNFISLCDGNNSLLQIAESLNVAIWNLYDIVEKLDSHNLINTIETEN